MTIEKFRYSVIQTDLGHTISLERTEDGKKKIFFIAGERPTGNLIKHMDSLTEDQCGAFFDDAKKRNSGKKLSV